jgi:hypothetical protein
MHNSIEHIIPHKSNEHSSEHREMRGWRTGEGDALEARPVYVAVKLLMEYTVVVGLTVIVVVQTNGFWRFTIDGVISGMELPAFTVTVVVGLIAVSGTPRLDKPWDPPWGADPDSHVPSGILCTR